MRFLTLLCAAATVSGFVVPDQETLNSLQLEDEQKAPASFWDSIPHINSIWEDFEEKYEEVASTAKDKVDDLFDSARHAAVHWEEKLEDTFDGLMPGEVAEEYLDLVDRPPHHRKPHHPHHPPHHGPPNQTVYELISKSKYTTKLTEAIDEFPDLVELLNGTSANFTVFAPTDRAFAKIPKHAPKPSKELLKKVLSYHVSPEFYPAGRVLVTRTIPTALEAEAIGKVPQRLSTQIGFRGLTVNFYSRIVAVDIFGTNGVIHGVDSLLIPPPKVVDILTALPGEFSTLELALVKTGLFPLFNDTTTHSGGTLFAPSNFAFQRLGPRINAFLFSKPGLKYLKALLLYHTAENITLYSDAIYKSDSSESGGHPGIPKGIFHIDLPSGLEGKNLSVDIARYGRLITIKINGFTRVSVSDGIAKDGVIHVIPNVLVPPKAPGGPGAVTDDMSMEELRERLEPFVKEDEHEQIDDEEFSFEL